MNFITSWGIVKSSFSVVQKIAMVPTKVHYSWVFYVQHWKKVHRVSGIRDIKGRERRQLILTLSIYFFQFHRGDKVIIFFPFHILKITSHKSFLTANPHFIALLALRKYEAYFSKKLTGDCGSWKVMWWNPKPDTALGIFHFISNERCTRLTNIPMKAAKQVQDGTASELWFSQVTEASTQENFCSHKNPNNSWKTARKTCYDLDLPAFLEHLSWYKEKQK